MGEAAKARARNARDFFEFLETLHPGAQAHLREALPSSVLGKVVGATSFDWNDVETVDGPYVTAIVGWLGDERARTAWRVYGAKHFIRTPAVRALAEGAARLFGLSVGSLVRMIPLAFKQGFRDCGEVKVEVGASEARVQLHLVESVAAHEAYAVMFHGLFLAIFDLVACEPSLVFSGDLRTGTLAATFRW